MSSDRELQGSGRNRMSEIKEWSHFKLIYKQPWERRMQRSLPSSPSSAQRLPHIPERILNVLQAIKLFVLWRPWGMEERAVWNMSLWTVLEGPRELATSVPRRSGSSLRALEPAPSSAQVAPLWDVRLISESRDFWEKIKSLLLALHPSLCVRVQYGNKRGFLPADRCCLFKMLLYIWSLSICCNKGHPETSMDCIMRKFREEGALGGAVESFMN